MNQKPKQRLSGDELDAFVAAFEYVLLRRLYGHAKAVGLRGHKLESAVYGQLADLELLSEEGEE